MTLQDSVRITKAYARHFGSRLNSSEVHRWLISSKRHTRSEVDNVIKNKTDKSHKKTTSLKISEKKIAYAKELVEKIKNFPKICFVGVTGSVSAFNAKEGDDIDILIITKKDYLWIIRPFLLIYVSLFFRRRKRRDPHTAVKNMFCFNLWLDEADLKLKVENRNLYTAHEVLQVFPVLNKNSTYEKFIKQNSWAKMYLANAYHLALHQHNFQHSKMTKSGSTNYIIYLLNSLFYFLQRLYMYPHHTKEKISLHSAFLHTVDHQERIKKDLGSL